MYEKIKPRPQALKPSCWSVPGKVFILGEYAVLHGAPALLAAVGPRFELRLRSQGATPPGGLPFAAPAQSPLGQLFRWAELLEEFPQGRCDFEYRDPFEGRGGFGSSSAQFALAFGAMTRSTDWKKAWRLYRALTAEQRISPSGADLVIQWRGGVRVFEPRHERVSEDLLGKLDWSGLLIFSAHHRKVKTHEHLDSLANQGFPLAFSERLAKLELITYGAIKAIERADLKAFGDAMNRYAETLWQCGLEHPQAHEDRVFFQSLKGVAGVKGSGAYQADAMLVLMDAKAAGPAEIARVVDGATKRGLRLHRRGLVFEPGMVCR